MSMKRFLPLLVLIAVLSATLALAQAPAQPAAAQGDFVPVSQLPAQAEQLPAAPLLLAAYAFVWVAVLVYVWSLWKRMAKLERELAELQRRVPKH
jgi:CcmD family protein